MAKSGMSNVESTSESSSSSEPEPPATEATTSKTNVSEQLLPLTVAPAECSWDEAIEIVSKSYMSSTPISLIIQSLLKTLCSVYEQDDEIAQKVYGILCNRLHELGVIDESFAMNEFETMRSQYQRTFHKLLSGPRGDPDPLARVHYALRLHKSITGDWSHYEQEFDEISYIAGGGFGKVYQARNKLDGVDYAIKKIYIRTAGIKSIRSYLSEVKTFASVNHANVVPYKAAWLELGVPEEAKARMESSGSSSAEDEEDEEETEHVTNSFIYPPSIALDEITVETSSDSSEFRVTFEKSRHISFSSKKKRKRTKRSSISEGGNAICTVEEIRRLQTVPKKSQKFSTLYIQMALCQMTLKNWMENRNSARSDYALVPIYDEHRKTVMEILRQILKGIEYIHLKGIVHHDIKPSNIFIEVEENGRLLVQLGDFGLACPLQNSTHKLAFGTKIYAAPEQLSGKCDAKSDLYSLGIVLLELVESYNTDMERIQQITELRKGHIPRTVCLEQPQFAQIIGQLVVRRSRDRPTASELLTKLSEIVEPSAESKLVHDLKTQLARKDAEIERLRELLKTAGLNA